MKIFTTFCVILFAWGVTADSISDIPSVEELLSKEIGHESQTLAESILQIIERFRGVINDAVKNLIESQRHIIRTGIPPNIPPLDPLYIDEYLIEAEEVTGFSNFRMTLNDTILKGLYDFNIEQVDIRPFGRFGLISISFEKLEMEGFHSTQATILGGILPGLFTGNGPFTMTLNNFRASAFVEIEFNGIRPNLKTLVVTYSTFSVQTNFTGFGSLRDPIFNAAASVAFPAIIVLNNIETNLWIHDELIPAVNEVINELTLFDIIGLIRFLIRNNAESFDKEIMDAFYRFDQINSHL